MGAPLVVEINIHLGLCLDQLIQAVHSLCKINLNRPVFDTDVCQEFFMPLAKIKICNFDFCFGAILQSQAEATISLSESNRLMIK